MTEGVGANSTADTNANLWKLNRTLQLIDTDIDEIKLMERRVDNFETTAVNETKANRNNTLAAIGVIATIVASLMTGNTIPFLYAAVGLFVLSLISIGVIVVCEVQIRKAEKYYGILLDAVIEEIFKVNTLKGYFLEHTRNALAFSSEDVEIFHRFVLVALGGIAVHRYAKWSEEDVLDIFGEDILSSSAKIILGAIRRLEESENSLDRFKPVSFFWGPLHSYRSPEKIEALQRQAGLIQSYFHVPAPD